MYDGLFLCKIWYWEQESKQTNTNCSCWDAICFSSWQRDICLAAITLHVHCACLGLQLRISNAWPYHCKQHMRSSVIIKHGWSCLEDHIVGHLQKWPTCGCCLKEPIMYRLYGGAKCSKQTWLLACPCGSQPFLWIQGNAQLRQLSCAQSTDD